MFRAPTFEERMQAWLPAFPIPDVVDEPYGATAPLSFSQEDSWYQAALQRDAPTYQEYDAVLIRGRLDRDAMERAVAAFAARHDAFRVTFPDQRGVPQMRYRERASLPFTFVDARGATGDPRRFAETYVRRAVREQFDLRAAPPARVHLVRLGDDLHLFVVVLFHIIKDGTAEGVMMRDISRLYARELTGVPAALPALPTTLGEHARWQRRMRDAGAFESNVAWWVDALRGTSPVDVPGDLPRTAPLSDAGARTYRVLETDDVARLRALAHAEGATLFMALMTAFALSIHRYSNARDVPIAFPVRNRPESLHPIMGCFINTLIARAPCDPERSFREHLQSVRDVLQAAYEHQDAPFTEVVQRLAPVRRADQTPLTAALLLLRNPRIERMELPDCRCERLEIDVGIAKFDLTLECDELPDGMRMGLEYRTSLFRRATAERMVRGLQQLIVHAVADPDAPFAALDPLDELDHAQIALWTRGREASADGTLVAAFEAAAARDPAHPAVVDGDAAISYGELAAAALRVRAALRAAGDVKTVAIYGPRSAGRVIATLGTLFSGAAFLPIDSAHPPARVQFMLHDAQADAIIVSRDDAGAMPWPAPCIVLDDVLSAPPPPDAGATAPRPDDPAYVMYTSGSTGTPSGAVIPHRAIGNYVTRFREVCGAGPGDRILHLSSPSFDISVEELFGALASGATVCVSRAGIANAVPALLAECERLGVTILDLPTAYFNEVVAAVGVGADVPACVRVVVVGGETLTRERAEAFLKAAPHVRLVNGYGPTETAVAVTLADVAEELALHDGPLSIGRPIANVRLELLDEKLRPVAIGALGEIVVGGIAVGEGYRARPQLTGERFVRDPRTGERLYRTGDLGRFMPDGRVQFFGRRDGQMKVRGFRVERGEVEAALLRIGGVRDAAAFIDASGALVACIVGDVADDANALRERVRRQLPAHAVPDRIVGVRTIPMTANGKRDEPALARLAAQHLRSAQNGDARPPRTPVELMLVKIWEDALGRSPIDVEDDFFALGGHSLLSARVFTRIEAVFGRRLPLQTLFAHPTIAAVARVLERELPEPTSLLTVHEPQRGGRPVFFLHGDFNGGGLYTRRLAARLRVDRPLYVLAPHGSIGDRVPDSVEAIADDYVRLVREAQPHGPYTVGGFCLGAAVAVEIARRLRAHGEEVDRVIALQPASEIYLFAPFTTLAVRASRAIGMPRAASRFIAALKLPWRLFDRVWRFAAKAVDPNRRRLAYAALQRRWNRHVVQRRFDGPAPHWGDEIGDALVDIVNRYVPAPYDGTVDVVWAFESGDGPLARVALRRMATRVRVRYSPGSHMTALRMYTDELADIVSDALEGRCE